MTSTYLSFSIYGDLYAVPVEKALEVLEKQDYTKVPNAPEVIKGIINFRGKAIPLWDCRIKFNLPARHQDEDYVIVVMELYANNEKFHVGAIVDKVRNVLTLNNEEIKPVPPMSKEFNSDYLKGIIKINEQFVLLIDVDKIFSSSETKEIINNSKKTIQKNENKK